MSQRTLNFNAMAAASQKQLMDMTPSAYLINSGDVGANILIPPGGRVGGSGGCGTGGGGSCRWCNDG